jgi:cytochrome P450
MQNVPNDGLIYVYDSFFGQSYIFPSSHKAALEVLGNQKDYTRAQEVQMLFGKLAGPYGLLTTKGELHRQQRRLLNPAFGRKNVQQLHDIIWKQTAILIRQLQLQVDTESPSVEITDIIQ